MGDELFKPCLRYKGGTPCQSAFGQQIRHSGATKAPLFVKINIYYQYLITTGRFMSRDLNSRGTPMHD
jgi:hypothetical protein